MSGLGWVPRSAAAVGDNDAISSEAPPAAAETETEAERTRQRQELAYRNAEEPDGTLATASIATSGAFYMPAVPTASIATSGSFYVNMPAVCRVQALLRGKLGRRKAVLLRELRTARTHSAAYLPFLNAWLGTGVEEWATDQVVWASHDPRWSVLLRDYSAALPAMEATFTDLASNLGITGGLEGLVNSSPRASHVRGWPYIQGAPATEEPPVSGPWPLYTTQRGICQDSILGQWPVGFARLQEMLIDWKRGLQPTDTASPPLEDEEPPTPPPLPITRFTGSPPPILPLRRDSREASVLYVCSDHTEQLDFASEIRAIENSGVKLTKFERTTLQDLTTKLRRDPRAASWTILHFSVHGTLEQQMIKHIRRLCRERDIKFPVCPLEQPIFPNGYRRAPWPDRADQSSRRGL